MNSLDRYLALNHLIERLSFYSGFDPFAPTWRFDRHRISYLLNIFIGIFMTIWSVTQADNGIDIVKRSMGFGIFTQTLVKAIVLVYNAEIYQSLITRIKSLYRSKDKNTQAIMEKTIQYCEKVYRIISLVNSSAVVIFVFYPFIAVLFLDELNLMFPFYLPLLDQHSHIGFFTNSLFHTVLIIYTLLFHNAFDIAFICFTIHVVAMVDLIKIDYDDLAEFTEKCKVENDVDMKLIRQKLKGIIEAQKMLDVYVDKLNDFYNWPCFITSSTSTFSICVALLLMMIVRWPLAYGLCWALFGQIFAAYLNGEVVNHQFLRLNNFVYEFPWHKLRVSEQKMICFMIHKTQRPRCMDLIFIGQLNMETFSTICNAIYSYYNVVKTLLNNQ